MKNKQYAVLFYYVQQKMGFIQTDKDGHLPMSESTFSLNRLKIGNCNQVEFNKETIHMFAITAQYTKKLINTFKAFPLYLETKKIEALKSNTTQQMHFLQKI